MGEFDWHAAKVQQRARLLKACRDGTVQLHQLVSTAILMTLQKRQRLTSAGREIALAISAKDPDPIHYKGGTAVQMADGVD